MDSDVSDEFSELSLSTEPAVPRSFSSTSFLSKKSAVPHQQLHRDTTSLDNGIREESEEEMLNNSTNDNGDLMSDMQQDIHQLLTFACALVEENNNLKQILKGAIITFDDESMQEFYESVMHTVHHIPSLKSMDRVATVLPEQNEMTSITASTGGLSMNSTTPLLSCQESHHDIKTIEPSISHQPVSHTDTNSTTNDQIPTPDPPVTSDVAMETETTPTIVVQSSSDVNPAADNAAKHTADAIKKLYELTITESWKKRNEDQLMNKPVDSSPTRRRLWGKAFRKNGEQTNLLMPLSLKDEPGGRQRSRTLNLDEPQLYVRDLVPILDERNALKLKLFQLEEELSKQKKLFTSLAGRWGRTSSNASTLRRSMVPSIFETSEDEEETVPEVDRTPGSTLTRKTKLRRRTPQEYFVTDVKVTGYTKHRGNYVYVIEIVCSDGLRFELYRRYAEFFTFQNTLLQLFPAEAGKYNSNERVIPSLPAIDSFLSLFGRTNSESVIKSRLETINIYCKVLLLQLDPYISRDPFVTDFFRPTVGDKQLPKLQQMVNSLEASGQSTLSVYPQNIPAGNTFEEYIVMADFKSSKEGEMTVMAGDVVKVISREPTGWWLVCKAEHEEEFKYQEDKEMLELGSDDKESISGDKKQEEIGYVPGDFLRRRERIHLETSVEMRSTYLGFISPAAAALEEVDTSLRYVAIEDYQTEDGRQMSLMEGDHLVVIDKSEDGWWLATMNGKQGWVPASFLEPYDRRMKTSESSELESTEVTAEKYVTMAPFKAENRTDISLPQSATVEVIEKSISGWWLVRYNGEIGLAPASLLALTDSKLEIPDEQKFALTVDLGHGISGIIDPPPRSKRFLYFSQRQRASTDDKRLKLLEEAELPEASLEGPDSCDGGGLTVADRVKQQVNGKKSKFKTFVRTYSKTKRKENSNHSRNRSKTAKEEREDDSNGVPATAGSSSVPFGSGWLSEWKENN